MKNKYRAELKKSEALRLDAYLDIGGVPTIGWGHTGKVTMGDTITKAAADQLFRDDLEVFEERVNRLVKVDLTDSQFATLVSFDYNTGALHKSTLLKKLNKGDYDSVPEQLMRWVFVKKKKSNGLVNRRASEVAMWLEDSDTSDVAAAPSATSTSVVTKENVSWAAGIAATAAVPLAEGSGPVQWVVAGVIAVAFAVALYMFIKRRGA